MPNISSHDLTVAELNSIVQAIEDTKQELKDVNAEINELLGDRFDIEKKVLGLKKLSSEIGDIQDNGTVLTKTIHRTGLTAETISSQVRLLDRAQSNVQNSLSRVAKMIDLKTAVTDVDQAVKAQNYEKAARTCFDILSRDKKENLGFESVDQMSFMLLLELRADVRKQVEEKCKEAWNADDWDKVIDYAKMYAYLDNPAEGLNLHCTCLAKKLRKFFQDNALVLTANYSSADHVGMISEIVETVCNKFPGWAIEIEKIYGTGATLQLSREVQAVVSGVLGPIAKEYHAQKILPILNAITAPGKDKKVAYGTQEVGEVLGDCAECVLVDLVCCDFVIRKNAESALISLNETDNPAQFLEGKRAPLERTYLDDQIHNIVDAYTMLEYWLMQQNLKKAIEITETPEDQLTSTLVQDTFRILNAAAERAFATSHIDAACTVVNHIKTILDGEDSYFDLLRENLEEIQRVKLRAIFNQTQTEEDENKVYIALNNVSQSAQVIGDLKETLEDQMEEKFSDLEQKDKRKLSFLLDDFDGLVKKFDGLAEAKMMKHFENFHHLVDNAIVVSELNYKLSEQDFHVEQMKFGWVDKFKRAVEKPLVQMRQKFTEENFQRFANILLTYLVETIEDFIKKQEFTNWGGIILQGHIRTLSSYFNDNYDFPNVREKFSRLRNIVEFLQIKELSEVTVFLSQPKVDPRFVKQILRLRVDFSREQIDKL